MSLRTAAAAFAIGFVTIATSCGNLYTVVRRYQLPIAPQPAFSLPSVAEHGGYTLTRSPRNQRIADPCPGFTTYKLSMGRELIHFYVRVTAGPPQRLDVAYGYISSGVLPLSGGKPDPQLERRAAYWADVAAQLAMQGSGVEPIVPPGDSVRLNGNKEVELWCSGN
jgi:hypothetical protein